MDLLYKEETYRIRGAAFEVYGEMGNGYLESVYQECMEKELRRSGIPFVAQPELTITYKEEVLDQTYKPDLICFGCVLVELKAVKELANDHKAQTINYLKATGLKVALLINFGHFPGVEIERLAY